MGRKTLGLSQGFLPSFSQEQKDINMGVGGARRGDKPVLLRNHKMGGGSTQPVVAHTGEWRVPNFQGSGGDAIFNRAMVKSFGLPSGAKRITASSGFVPNYSNLSKKPVSASALELGFVTGGNSILSKKSDYFDSFSAAVNVMRSNTNSSDLGRVAKDDYSKFVKSEFIDEGGNVIKNPGFKKKKSLSRRYSIDKKEYKKFLKMGTDSITYGNLLKSSPYNGFKTGLRKLLKQSYKGTKQPVEVKKLFGYMTNNLKGARGEIEGASTLKSLGYKNIKAIPKSGSFDKSATAPGKNGKKVLIEDKSGGLVNRHAILKKGATEYLRSLHG